MASFQARKKQSGVALFIVLAAMSILSVLVTEFVYVGQVNKRIAYEGLDQLKAYYLAKSGFKISLLRLKAYQIIKAYLKGNGVDSVPTSVTDKVWSFPLFYPIPSDIPGITATQKDSIEKFTKESNLEGTFSALVEGESSKYNLNSILKSYAYALPTPSPSPPNNSGGGSANNENDTQDPNVKPTPSPTPTFNVETARQSLQDYLAQLLYAKFRDDRDFADLYRELKVEDLMDSIVNWADTTYESRRPKRDDITPKKAPFYSLSELRLLPEVDDALYDLLSGALTTSLTPGVHINTMRSETLSSLVPQLTKEEVAEFFKFRDATDKDNKFRNTDDFYLWLQDNTGTFRGNESAVTELKKSFEKRNIQLLIEEKTFRITVTAKIGGTSRIIQAWVELSENDTKAPTSTPSASGTLPVGTDGIVIRGQSGLKITFMRVF
ncbi:MAG: general secretion pathway protein GspK [Xanthomonadaceae bacterium]|nr:general secretion pathway protein GspK [Xanthomonadaceae bacterium]